MVDAMRSDPENEHQVLDFVILLDRLYHERDAAARLN
jgi:hypothetical protein